VFLLEEDKRLRELLIRATKDKELREKFLRDPEGVGKEFDVTFNRKQLVKIKRTAAFIEALNDIVLPPGPIFYPLDQILVQWKIDEMLELLRYRLKPMPPEIFYPAPWILRRRIL